MGVTARTELQTCDEIANHQSHRAYHRLTLLRGWDDPFYLWVADLGRREGEWLLEHGACPAGVR